MTWMYPVGSWKCRPGMVLGVGRTQGRVVGWASGSAICMAQEKV